MKLLPPLSYLKECFVYERRAGRLFWRQRPIEHFVDKTAQTKWNARYAGAEAFITEVNGYRYSHIGGIRYAAHRVVWKLETGEEPPPLLDHKNRRRSSNVFKNLRPLTNQQNVFNRNSNSGNNNSGRVGVYYKASRGHYYAHIRLDSKQCWLGSFKTLKEAVQARIIAEKKFWSETQCA